MEHDKSNGFEFSITEADVVERADFHRFEILITKKGAMFKTYTGFHVWTTPYAVATDGVARENSLYKWLCDIVALKKEFAGHENEPLSDGNEATKGDLMYGVCIATEANLISPITAFIDRDAAMTKAAEHMEWLISQIKRLQSVAESAPIEEDEKKNAEFNAKVEVADIIHTMAKEEGIV